MLLKFNSSPVFLTALFSVRSTIWILAENWTLGQGGGLGLLTTIHLLRANALLHQVHLLISFFDKMSSASSLLSSSLPASFKLFNYIVFTIPYCLAFGHPYNYQISSHVKSLLLVFLPILLNIHLVAQSWHWYIKQLRIEWSQMQRGLILLFIL